MTCDLNHNEDQRQIIAAATSLLNASYPVSRLRDEAADDLAALAEFGIFALALSEEHGGSGFTIVEEALVHGLLGRHVISPRVLATAITARLAAQLGNDHLVEQAAAGALGICAAVRSGDSILLIDAGDSALALVFGARQLELVRLEGLEREKLAGLGHGVSVTRVRPAPADVIGESGDSGLRNLADLLVSAHLLGIAEASRDLAVSYAKIREQFGRPIGSFQAIKHHCANMAVAAEAHSAQLDMAAIALRDGRDDADYQIAALRLLAPKVALSNARISIQVHGGIGFSSEADAHHYLKHAHVLRLLLSGAEMLDLPAPLAPHSPSTERN